jgi:hypothetical protein
MQRTAGGACGAADVGAREHRHAWELDQEAEAAIRAPAAVEEVSHACATRAREPEPSEVKGARIHDDERASLYKQGHWPWEAVGSR